MNALELHQQEMGAVDTLLIGTGTWQSRTHRQVTRIHIDRSETRHLKTTDGERVVLHVAAGVTATILEETVAGETMVDLLIGENAHVVYASIVHGKVLVHRFAYLETDASIHWVDVADGSAIDASVTTYLAGTGASARFESCFLGTERQNYRILSRMIHAGDRSTSTMLTRGALLANSTGSYDGLIRILPGARGCEAYQRGEFLLLSADAHMRAEPNLEIGNPEVKCSHGVSISRIDEEKLFYFRTRGLTVSDAKRLIIAGFFAQIIDKLPHGADAVRVGMSRRIPA